MPDNVFACLFVSRVLSLIFHLNGIEFTHEDRQIYADLGLIALKKNLIH